MIRFIYIGDQITKDSQDFAFYDTVTDKFLQFDGESVFEDREDFATVATSPDDPHYARCVALIPPNIK